MKKVISLKEIKYTKMYKLFYSDPKNLKMSTSVFFKGDTVKKIKVC